MNFASRTYLIITLTFLMLGIVSRAQQTPMKIYLEDGLSNKEINNAKVVLSGFDLPEIIGKYDKKGKFYYFNNIPEGYNTVIAYHKKYSEKGYQNLIKLPKEIILKLFPIYNVTYNFLKLPDEITYPERDREIAIKNNGQFKDIYVEDPYKILIVSDKEGNFKTIRDTIYNIIQYNKLDLIPVNPYLSESKNSAINKLYPDCTINKKDEVISLEWLEKNKDCSTLPFFKMNLESYLSNNNVYGSLYAGDIGRNIMYFYAKRDGEKFNRFNDPVLKKLSEQEGIRVYMLIYKKLQYRGEESYNHKKFDIIDKKYYLSKKEHNYKFYPNIFSTISFYKNEFNFKEVFNRITNQSTLGLPGGSLHDEYSVIPIFYEGTYGLGILDNMDFHQRGSLDISAEYKKEELLQYYDEGEGGWTEKAFWKKEEYLEFKKNNL